MPASTSPLPAVASRGVPVRLAATARFGFGTSAVGLLHQHGQPYSAGSAPRIVQRSRFDVGALHAGQELRQLSGVRGQQVGAALRHQGRVRASRVRASASTSTAMSLARTASSSASAAGPVRAPGRSPRPRPARQARHRVYRVQRRGDRSGHRATTLCATSGSPRYPQQATPLRGAPGGEHRVPRAAGRPSASASTPRSIFAFPGPAQQRGNILQLGNTPGPGWAVAGPAWISTNVDHGPARTRPGPGVFPS